jgi:hypothetical protein
MRKTRKPRKAAAKPATRAASRKIARALRSAAVFDARASFLRCLLRQGRLEKCCQMVS